MRSSPRPRFALAPDSVAELERLRRDPRAERQGQSVGTAVRLRLDRLHRSPHGPAPSTLAEQAGQAPEIIVVEQPAYLVMAVADAPGGRLTAHDRQVLGAARLLAATQAASVLLGPPLDDNAGVAGVAGADRVCTATAFEAEYDPEGRTAAVAHAIAALQPRHVIFPESAEGGDLARRVAARLREPLFTDVEALSARAVSRPAAARRLEQRAAPPRLIALADGAAPPYAGAAREGRRIEFPSDASPDARKLERSEVAAGDPGRVPLGEAAFVVAAGAGVSNFQTFAALAAALGAAPGASRVVCDAGSMPKDRQVGASGSVLDAVCYLALGIAGAPQHLQGIGRVEHVLAVNTDLHAAMIARAELAIIADVQAVMPALLAALEGERAMTP